MATCASTTGAKKSMRLQQILVFLGIQVHSRHRLDPAQVVVDLLDPGNILRRDDGCLPRILVGYHAAEMHDTVEHDDAESEGRPISLLDECDDTASNMIVVGSRIRDVARKTRNGGKQIGAGHDP